MTRGFITLATGKELYYQLARNLLMSYRLYTQNPMRFAIMCDRENEYTALFEQLIHKGGFAVVYVRYDGYVSYVFSFHTFSEIQP